LNQIVRFSLTGWEQPMGRWFKNLDRKERLDLVQAAMRGVGAGVASAFVSWLTRAL
jgi:hypothetical protein